MVFFTTFFNVFYSKIGLYYFRQVPYDGGIIVYLMMTIMVVFWGGYFCNEIYLIKKLRDLLRGYNHYNSKETSTKSFEVDEQSTKHEQEPFSINENETKAASFIEGPLSKDIILGNLVNKEQGIPMSSLSSKELSDVLEKSTSLDGELSSSTISRQEVRGILDKLVKNSSDAVLKQAKESIFQPNKEFIEPYDPKRDLENYHYPTLDLLIKYENDGLPYINMEEQNANKNRIIETLRNFGAEISSLNATAGPRFTLYEITPVPGVSIYKIRGLEDDIALQLGTQGVRIIAPIPGKGTVGIEVPNMKVSIASIESILNSKKFQESTMELPCALGKTITNEVFMFDLTRAPPRSYCWLNRSR